jgi:Bacteriophage lambda head decoration protein D
MAANVTPVGNNPFQPGMVSETYIPDQLIAGDLKIVTDSVTITATDSLKRGQFMAMDSATGKWSAWAAGGAEGTPAAPMGILVDDINDPSGDVTGGIYLTGQFNGNCTTPLGTTLTYDEITALRNAGIFMKNSVVSASDPG